MQLYCITVSKVIRNIRRKRGLSQDVVSGLAGIGRTHLSMIENGAKKPSLETIWRIAYALNIRPSELVALVEVEMQNQEIEIETE